MRSLLPSAFAGRVVPSEAASSGPSRFSVFGSRHPRRRSPRPCGFPAMRPACLLSFLGRRPDGSFVAAFLSADVPDLDLELFAAWPGFCSPATLLGFAAPFAVLLLPAGEDFLSKLRTHLPFRPHPPRVVWLAESASVDRRMLGRGSWVLASQASRTVNHAGPAIAFARRAAHLHRPGLPWVLFLLQVFGRGAHASTATVAAWSSRGARRRCEC